MQRLPPLSNPTLHFASLLQSLTKSKTPLSFPLGLSLHSHLLKSGLVSDRFVGNTLLSFYFALSPDFSLTSRLFHSLPSPDVVSWTSIIYGHLRSHNPLRSLQLFVEMSVPPNAFTLSVAVKACSALPDLTLGRCFHSMVINRGFDSNHVIGSSLVDMYGRNFALDDARKVFDGMSDPDAVSWTSMISACTRNDRFEEALGLFYSMGRDRVGLFPDGFTFGSVLTALGNLGRGRQGKEAHAKVIVSGLGGNVVVESSVVDMYAKCGLVGDSRRVFDGMPAKNMVSWCALLNGYCQSGGHEEVIGLFREMGKDGDWDHYSFGTVLRSCAGLTDVRKGKEIHCRFLRTGGWRDVVVESALVDLYAKSGLIDYARSVFAKISSRNLITWNAMIGGLAQNGRGGEAVKLFDEMLREGTKPDYITFIGVLFACSHTGLIKEGKKYFRSMSEDYGIKPGIEHYNCMVDLLSRVGLLEEAEGLIEQSLGYSRDSSLWAALLGACATHSSPGVAERVAKKMMELEPGYHLSYVLLANVYKTVGRWNDAVEIWRLMKERGVKKAPGKSWIEVKSGICSYFSDADSISTESQGFEEFKLGG